MSEIKLKPCPFCGGEAHLEHSRVEMSGRTNADIVTTWNVRCANCGTEKRGLASHYVIGDDEVLRLVDDAFMDGRMFAITQWNRREDDEQGDGEWVKSEIPGEEYVCSACGGACWYYDVQGVVAKSRYCPNCGARMKGGAE